MGNYDSIKEGQLIELYLWSGKIIRGVVVSKGSVCIGVKCSDDVQYILKVDIASLQVYTPIN